MYDVCMHRGRSIQSSSQRFGVSDELHVKDFARRERGNVVSLVDIPDIQVQSPLSSQLLLHSLRRREERGGRIKKGGRERWREGEREEGREGGREGGRKGGREEGREGGREGRREGVKEGGRRKRRRKEGGRYGELEEGEDECISILRQKCTIRPKLTVLRCVYYLL